MESVVVSPKEFIDIYGIGAAKDVVGNANFKEDVFYCHLHCHGFITIRQTYSDRPNIDGATWVKISELKDYLKTTGEL